MRSLTVLVALFSAIAICAEPTTARRIPDLVAQLGSTNYQEREAAFRALDELGESGLSDLRGAMSSSDSEVSRRATELVRRIEQRLSAAERLAPTMVNIDIDNKSIVDAVKEFNEKSKLPVAIPKDVDKTKLKERRVTFKTNGPVPAWVAWEQFLKAANLTEWDGITPGVLGMPIPTVQAENGQWVQIGRARVQMQSNVRPATNLTKEIYVFEGLPTPIPTVQAGAVRVRILPISTPIPNTTADADELLVPIQITAEPKLMWHSHPAIKHAQAVDHRGQKLTASVVGAGISRDYDDFGMNGIAFRDPFSQAPVNPQRSQYLALRFRRGTEPSKSLKELNGTFSLPFRTDGEVLSLAQVMQSAGKSARSVIGANLTVASIARAGTDELKLELSVDLPPEVTPVNYSSTDVMSGAQQVQGGMWGNMQITVNNKSLNVNEYLGISVLNSEGKRLPFKNVRDMTVSQGSDGMKIKMTLLAKLPKDAPEPSRIVFRASYPTSVEVGFAFKDVALQ